MTNSFSLRLPTFLAIAALVSFFSLGCGKKSESMKLGASQASGPQPGGKVSLNGAGATFPFPLYSKWMSEYNKLNPNIQINYQSIGSGGGIRQVTAGTVDFGATDAPMSEEDEKKASGKLHHIPMTIGAVVVSYNVPGVTSALKLSGPTLADIFLGKIDKWNDPKIVGDNEGVSLPDTNITVIYRSDGSGTTAVFTDYLAKVAPEWTEKVGVGKAVRWPKGLGAKGNEGVTGQLKISPGAIGYIELAYATQNNLNVVEIRNKAGRFIKPDVSAISLAAAKTELPEGLFASIADGDDEGAYPIAAFTYLLVYQDAKDAQKGQALANFVWWAIHDGQKFAADLHYAPLPEAVVQKVSARVKGLTFSGKPLLKGE